MARGIIACRIEQGYPPPLGWGAVFDEPLRQFGSGGSDLFCGQTRCDDGEDLRRRLAHRTRLRPATDPGNPPLLVQ